MTYGMLLVRIIPKKDDKFYNPNKAQEDMMAFVVRHSGYAIPTRLIELFHKEHEFHPACYVNQNVGGKIINCFGNGVEFLSINEFYEAIQCGFGYVFAFTYDRNNGRFWIEYLDEKDRDEEVAKICEATCVKYDRCFNNPYEGVPIMTPEEAAEVDWQPDGPEDVGDYSDEQLMFLVNPLPYKKTIRRDIKENKKIKKYKKLVIGIM